MASPLSSLKKTRKNPLSTAHPQSHEPPSQKPSNIPYRHGNDTLLDEVTTRIFDKKYDTSHSKTLISECSSGTPSDIDLMQTMVSRIAILEKHISIQAKQIQDKDKRVSVLEDKCRLYQKMISDECQSPAYVKELEAKCLLLQQQISEMEDFLLDYGMIWVGQQSDDEDEVNDTVTQTPGGHWNQNNSLALDQPAKEDNPYNIDFDRLIENIEELNAIAGEGEAKIEKTPSGARFKVPDPIRLILYKNGIVMFEGPFRPYDDETTQICLTDILDGYFPSELQKAYPDGVPFKIVDKRNITFTDHRTKAFTGSGQQLGGETQPSRLIPSSLNKELGLKNTESKIPGSTMNADQFLSQLPSSVIKGGRVIDIRSSVGEQIKGNDSENAQTQVTIVETQTMQEIKDRLEIDENIRPPSGKNITTLRVKDVDNHTYVLKMKFTDTIRDVIIYLNDLRDSMSGKYDLVTTFPNKTYKDMNESLFNAGLTPNATMHIRKK